MNITPANIGLGSVNNTADSEKSVKYAASAGSVAWDNVSGKPSSYTPSSHTHDDRYYTESEVNNLLNSKADSNHSHSYLPLSGGTMNGNIGMNGKNITGVMTLTTGQVEASANISADVFSTNAGKVLAPNGYLNLQANEAAQARNYGDTDWVYINARGFTTQSNSSRKLKDNIKDITDERARQILDVNIVTFDYKEGIVAEDHRYDRTGVIAEDTESVCPEVINYDNGEVSGVQYDRFIPYLIRMVQLQQEEIDRLKADMQQLANAD